MRRSQGLQAPAQGGQSNGQGAEAQGREVHAQGEQDLTEAGSLIHKKHSCEKVLDAIV
jgi:hypothetical protein